MQKWTDRDNQAYYLDGFNMIHLQAELPSFLGSTARLSYHATGLRKSAFPGTKERSRSSVRMDSVISAKESVDVKRALRFPRWCLLSYRLTVMCSVSKLKKERI
jgi:hypothetical protein